MSEADEADHNITHRGQWGRENETSASSLCRLESRGGLAGVVDMASALS